MNDPRIQERHVSRVAMLLFAATMLQTLSSSALAGSNENAKISCHIQVHSTSKGSPSPCSSPPLLPCNQNEGAFNVTGDVETPYDLYLLVADGDSAMGVAGVSLGITYKGDPGVGVDVFAWSLCADLEFGSNSSGPFWPSSGAGNVITWDAAYNCQKTGAPGDLSGGVTAVIGAFYVIAYSPDIFRVTTRTYVHPPRIVVVNCAAEGDTISVSQNAGRVGFGSQGGGFDPCD